MPTFPKHIQIDRRGSGSQSWSFKIDGEDFPWHVVMDSMEYIMASDGVPMIRFTLAADKIEISDDMSAHVYEKAAG